MSRILVTDFDGTLCQNEFYQLALERLLPPETPDYWKQYTSGQLSHLEMMQAYFSSIRGSEEEVLSMLDDMEFEPRFGDLIPRLLQAGWEVVIASAGCGWYIERLIKPFGFPLTIHASPGRWVGGESGLVMEPPRDSPFFSESHGIDKAAIVRDALRRSEQVVYAGDGYSDVPAMLLLPEDCRFARRDAARTLDERGAHYRPFERWAVVAESLLQE